MIVEILLIVVGVYLLCGLVFAIPFVLVGAGKIDPHATHGSWGFKVLIIPGTMFLWPLLARRWLKGIHEPPEENNPHRCATRSSGSSRCEKAHAQIQNPKAEIRNRPSLVTSAATSGREGVVP
jgi:hypothetical protein